MKFSSKQNERDARERLRAFWAGSSLGRPALHMTVKKTGVSDTIWTGEPDRKKRDLMPEWQVWTNMRRINNVEYAAEAFPSVELVWGANISLLAIQAGGDYEYDENGHAWVKPLPEVFDRPAPSFDPSLEIIRKLDACYEKAAEAFAGKAYINPPVMLDALTTLSLLRQPDQLCVDMIERPDVVKEMCAALTDLYIKDYDYFYQKISHQGFGETSSWLQAMAEGRFEAVQCDFAVMISPAMFEEFVLPDLERLTRYFDYSLYHLDGTSQMRFLNQLRSLPRLTGIQWNPEPAAGSPTGWLDAFREIRKRKFCIHIWCDTLEEAVILTRELGPDGLMLVVREQFDSEAAAEAAIKRIEAACR